MKIEAFNHYWLIRWYWLVLFLLAQTLLIGLSLWQLQRATEKTKILSRIDVWQQKGSLDIAALKEFSDGSTDAAPVEFKARWLAPYVWLWDNKILKGRVGYDVLIPVTTVYETFSIENSGKLNVVLVNLGWIEAPRERGLLPVVNVPAEFIVQGIFRTHPSGILLGDNLEDKGTWPMRIQQPDSELLSRLLSVNFADALLLPGVIYQQGLSPYTLHYQPVVMLPEKHRAYAVQWALLALALAIITVIAGAHKTKSE